MKLKLTEAEWQFLVQKPLGAHERKMEIFLLHYAHRFDVFAIAAALGITVNNVRVQISSSWTLITLFPWDEADREYVCDLIRRGEVQDEDAEGPLTDYQHARAILAAMRLPVTEPVTPAFDECGQERGIRSPLVPVDVLVDHIKRRRAQREQETAEAAPVPPGSRVNPYQGERARPRKQS